MRRYGPEFPETLFALAQLGEILATRGKLEEARSVLAPLPDAYARAFGPDHFQRGSGVAQLRPGARGDGGSRRRRRRSTGSRWRSTRRGSPGGFDQRPARGHAPRLPGPRRADPRPRRRGRDGAPADPADAREDPAPPHAGRPLAGALADALADRGDPKVAIELLKAVHNDSARLDTRLDWLLPHLRSVIGGYQLRLGDRDKAAQNLRTAVERMEKSYLKPPAPVLAAAARAAGASRRGEGGGKRPGTTAGSLTGRTARSTATSGSPSSGGHDRADHAVRAPSPSSRCSTADGGAAASSRPAPTATSGSPSRDARPRSAGSRRPGHDHRVPACRRLAADAGSLTAGPDGNLWFTENAANGLEPGSAGITPSRRRHRVPATGITART